MTNYKIGTFNETVDGKAFVVLKTAKFDSDAQAELNARHIAEDNGLDGVHIKRGDAEWYVSA